MLNTRECGKDGDDADADDADETVTPGCSIRGDQATVQYSHCS